MNILLTNDDGYSSKGILTLKKLLSKYGRVVIVAPAFMMSGKSCSITINEPLELNKVDDDIYSFSGTPADCVCFGLTSFDIDFDLVVSGINHGLNLSYDTMYSGTIGACLQALVFKKKTFAVSVDSNFELVEQYFDKLFKFIIQNELLNSEYLLNINFPYGDKVDDIALTSLYYREDEHQYVKCDEGWRTFRKCQTDFESDKNSDCYSINHGIISVTPLSRSYFSSSLLNELQNKLLFKQK